MGVNTTDKDSGNRVDVLLNMLYSICISESHAFCVRYKCYVWVPVYKTIYDCTDGRTESILS